MAVGMSVAGGDPMFDIEVGGDARRLLSGRLAILVQIAQVVCLSHHPFDANYLTIAPVPQSVWEVGRSFLDYCILSVIISAALF